MPRTAFRMSRAAARCIANTYCLKNPVAGYTFQHTQRSPLGILKSHLSTHSKYPLRSEFQLRSVIIFFVSSLMASGIWVAREDISSRWSSIFSTSCTPNAKQYRASRDDRFLTDESAEQLVSKQVNGSRLKVERLTPELATRKLRENERSYTDNKGQGILRYDVTQLASNSPIEDDYVQDSINNQDTMTRDGTTSDWVFWGVFDGHSGWSTAAKLRQALVPFVTRELDVAYSNATVDSVTKTPTPEDIDAAIKKAFLRLDDRICHESVQKALKTISSPNAIAVELLAPAIAGACALLSFYDCKTQLLRVACTGDSRAVLGRRSTVDGIWSAIPLSEDQTGGTPFEIARLRKEHPGEQHVTRKGRILGHLQPSRAFGDAIYKWDRQTALQVKNFYFGRPPFDLSKTPPYVTAEPVITTMKIEPGDFLVMATDGLWECLTNEEVVGLVGQWLNGKTQKPSSTWLSWFTNSNSDGLPVDYRGGSPNIPSRQRQWSIQRVDQRFVVEDDNAATHLLRNALGGRNKDLICALLSLPSPYSRRFRDDLTIQVILFSPNAANEQS